MKHSRKMQRGQWSLIGTLVAVAILIALAAWLIPKYALRHSESPKDPATPIERAHGAGCVDYTSQMNQAVELYKQDHDDQLPKSLDDLKQYKVTDEMIHAQGCVYQLDSTTGQVTETGHGRGPLAIPPGP